MQASSEVWPSGLPLWHVPAPVCLSVMLRAPKHSAICFAQKLSSGFQQMRFICCWTWGMGSSTLQALKLGQDITLHHGWGWRDQAAHRLQAGVSSEPHPPREGPPNAHSHLYAHLHAQRHALLVQLFRPGCSSLTVERANPACLEDAVLCPLPLLFPVTNTPNPPAFEASREPAPAAQTSAQGM